MALFLAAAFALVFPSKSGGRRNERRTSRAPRATNQGKRCERHVAGRGALLRCAHVGWTHPDRTAVPGRSRRKLPRGLGSGFALRIPATVPQPGLFYSGYSVLDLG